jgi:hypothetical protein
MTSEEPELRTEKATETMFRRLRRHWLIAAMVGFLLATMGIALPPAGALSLLLWLLALLVLLVLLAGLVRSSTVLAGCATLLVALICGLGALYLWARSCATPPRDAKLVRQFYAHRDDFEKLCKMLQEDGSIKGVATYGVSTTNPDDFSPRTPEKAGLPKGRYEEYLTTLKKAGAIWASHNEQKTHHPEEFRFLIRRWGFAGEGWGLFIISRDTEPTNQVASLDDFGFAPESSLTDTSKEVGIFLFSMAFKIFDYSSVSLFWSVLIA